MSTSTRRRSIHNTARSLRARAWDYLFAKPKNEQPRSRARLTVESLEGRDLLTTSTSTMFFDPGFSVTAGQNAAFVDLLSVPTGTGTPTGTIAFSATNFSTSTTYPLGTLSLGSFNSMTGVAVTTLDTNALPAATYGITAAYSGDSNFDPSSATGVFVVNAAGTNVPLNVAPGPDATCPPSQYNNSPASGGATQNDTSVAGVRYGTGTVSVSRTDLDSGGYGTFWGQMWSWTNATGYTDNSSGSGGTQTQAPHLVQVSGDDSIAMVTSATTAHFFDSFGGAYHPRFYDTGTLTHDTTNHLFVLGDDTGKVFTFYDFSGSTPTGRAGKLISIADAAGGLTQVTSWDSAGRPTEVQRVSGSGSTALTESFLTTYVASGVNAGLVETVTQRSRVGTGSWTTTRLTEYSYYDGTTGPGLAGALKLAVVKDASGGTISTDYYRYFTSGTGSTGKLQFAFGTASFGLLTAAVGTGLDSLTDTQVAPYADKALTYDTSGRVTAVVDAAAGCSVCTGGQGTFSYAYTTNSAAGLMDYNSWQTKTVETLPDGSTNTVYTNAFGQVMMTVFDDVNTSGNWITYNKFDSVGRTLLEANPSAVTGYNDSYNDLVHYTSGNAQYLSDSDGLITKYEYASTTTAMTATPGDVAGYLKEVDITHGETGADVPQMSMDYILRTVGSQSFFHVASETVYRNDDGTGAQTTSYDYTFQGSTDQIESITTTLPTISTGQNGSGTADSVTSVMDQFGRRVWSMDQAGFINYLQYDDVTGAVVKVIADVDTTQTSTFTNLPSGWTTPSGGGKHLTTNYEVDSLGRVTKETTPEGRVNYTVYNDSNQEVRSYTGWDSTANLPTGPTTVMRQDLANGYTESLTMTATPSVSSGKPTGSESIANVQSLSRSYINEAGQVVYSDAYFNLGGLTYSTAANIGTEGVNFYRTRFQYDDKGNLTRTVSPQGTITRTVYDGLSRSVSKWVGTDDTPTSGVWSPTNLTGTDMVKTADYEYDGGGVGDSNLTKVTEHPGGSAADRVTQMWQDWRNRTVATKSGVETSESTSVNRPLVYSDYDNLGQTTKTRVYDADGVTPTVTSGVPQPLSSSLLRSQSTSSFDDLGRDYRTETYSVDPSSGSVSTNTLHTDLWRDSRGNVIKTASPGGLVQKQTFDGVNWLITSYTTDGGGDSSYADADDVTGDVVLQQSTPTFDNDGNVIKTTTKQRFAGETGTGALGTPTTGVHARVSYDASYFDLGGRLAAYVDVGTNGGTAWTRPSTVPSRSDTVLVTSNGFAADAVQTVKLSGSPTGGTFTLTFGGQTTSNIAYNASASAVQSALAALSSVGSGNVVVAQAVNGGWEVRFTGSLGGKFQLQMTANGSGLTGGTSPSVALATISLGGDAGNVVDVTDPRGLVSRTYSDPLGRAVQSIENFTDGIVTDSSNKKVNYAYNGAGMTSLTAELTNGTGQTTAWVYGVSSGTGSAIASNDIVGVTQWPDKTTGAPSSSEQETSTVNALGEATTMTDRNGSVHTLTRDVLGRAVSDAVTTLGSGVDGSVRRIDTAYDGQGNAFLVTSYDAATGGSIVNQVQREFNGLGQMTTEWQSHSGAVNTSTTPKIQYSYSEMASGANHSRLTGMVYPSGFDLRYDYGTSIYTDDAALDDRISRVADVFSPDDNTLVQAFDYLGLGTVIRDARGNSVQLTLANVSGNYSGNDAGDQYVGLDRFGRVVDQQWYTGDQDRMVDDTQYAYDRDSNRTSAVNGLNSAFSQTFSYDGLNQLTGFNQGSGTHTQAWDFDALGNWDSVTTDGGTPQTRSANAQNQITSISGATTPTYDANGNMTGDETGKTFVYDAWNRLVAVKSGSTVLKSYGYDGLNHRVTETTSSTVRDLYYSAGWQVVEETVTPVGGGTTKLNMRYVWGAGYVDDMVYRQRDTDGNGTLDDRLWPTHDANFNITALADDAGWAVERFVYDPFGARKVYDADYNSLTVSAYDFNYGFQGLRRDLTSGLDAAQERWYSPVLGRWTRNDPLTFGGGDNNLYAFVSNSPPNRNDPRGLCAPPVGCEGKSVDLSKEIVAGFDKAWKDSQTPNVGWGQSLTGWGIADNFREAGGSIIRIGEGKDQKIEIRQGKLGNTSTMARENFPVPGKGETLQGQFHTHPYPANLKGWNPDVAHSIRDVFLFLLGDRGSESFVVTRNCIYLLKVDFPFTFQEFAKSQKAQSDKKLTFQLEWEMKAEAPFYSLASDVGTQQAQERLITRSIRNTGVVLYKACKSKAGDPYPTTLCEVY